MACRWNPGGRITNTAARPPISQPLYVLPSSANLPDWRLPQLPRDDRRLHVELRHQLCCSWPTFSLSEATPWTTSVYFLRLSLFYPVAKLGYHNGLDPPFLYCLVVDRDVVPPWTPSLLAGTILFLCPRHDFESNVTLICYLSFPPPIWNKTKVNSIF